MFQLEMKIINSISPKIYRRFVLGAQGLWPERRWEGKAGTAQAIRTAQAIQVDPVAVVAPSHDIALWGRVKEYRQQFSLDLVYKERKFFDYHTNLRIYPIEDFPYWRRRMERRRQSKSMRDYFAANKALLAQVRDEIRTRGPLRSRDIKGKRVNAYRSSKDSGVAMFNLWITGELTIHSRKGRDRVYDFTEKLIPEKWHYMAPEAETDEFFLRKELRHFGLSTRREFRNILKRVHNEPIKTDDVQARLEAMLTSGELCAVELVGSAETLYYLSEGQALLDGLIAGRIPAEWKPLDTNCEDEVVFLAPLEIVSARGRAKGIFNFDYSWEIYKPAHTRKYGPYTLPMLYGDQLVGRMDSKLDRQSKTLIINGLWLEEDFQADKAFSLAFARGLESFARFLQAECVDIANLEPLRLYKTVRKNLESIKIM